jgi:hypothetical protein
MNKVETWLVLEELSDSSYKEIYRTEDYYDAFKVYCKMLESPVEDSCGYCVAFLEAFSKYHSFNEEHSIWVEMEDEE